MSNVRQFPDALIDAIYSGLIEESPWIKALELLRVASESNVACLRISVKGAHPREYLFAAGPKASKESISEWETRSSREMMPVALAVGEPQAFDWSVYTSFSSIPDLLQRYEIRSARGHRGDLAFERRAAPPVDVPGEQPHGCL